MNLFYQPLIPQGIFFLDTDESKHCIKALRKKNGDHIRVTDGKGFYYEAVIRRADSHRCEFEIVDTIPESQKNFSIHIAIAPTKNADRIEWFTEKAVELGVDRITLIQCKNSERTRTKTERLNKVAISAMKQSLKASVPHIEPVTAFDQFVDKTEAQQKFIAHVDETNPNYLRDMARPCMDYVVLIGPEGDFTSAELEQANKSHFTKISLGTSRLRTETAGLAACHILNLINT